MKSSGMCQRIKDYVVLDTETTGLSPYYCKITEISMAKIRDGVIVDSFTTLVNPGRHIPKEISCLTGITDEMVCCKPFFDAIADKVVSFLGDDVVVGHNVKFDIAFLNMALEKPVINETLDTRILAKKVFPGLCSYSLEYLARYFDICEKQLHRAEADVVLTKKLYDVLTRNF